jgi:hypothetical protein
MANRHQRRKAAKVKAQAKTEALAQAQRSMNVSSLVRKNKARPFGIARFVFVAERIRNGCYYSEVKLVYDKPCYATRAPIADAKGNIFTGYREPRAAGSMKEKAVQALKARKNVSFHSAGDMSPCEASLEGQRLSGRKILQMERAILQAKLDRLRNKA